MRDDDLCGATTDEVIESLQEDVERLRAECDGAGRVIASLIAERDEERFERKALQIVIDGQNDVIKLRVRERDEAITGANLKLGTMEMVLADKAAAERDRDRLREYVGRLEAALVRLHEIYAWGVQQNDDDEHETWWKAALECVALGREIAGRTP